MNDRTRRADVNRNIPAEIAIRDAMLAVEALPANEQLTEAVVLLDRARELVADYVDARRLCACGGTGRCFECRRDRGR